MKRTCVRFVLFYFFACLLLLLNSCQKQDQQQKPAVSADAKVGLHAEGEATAARQPMQSAAAKNHNSPHVSVPYATPANEPVTNSAMPEKDATENIPPQGTRALVINRVRLTDDQIQALESRYRVHIQDGHYWYDKISGAWGLDGGPTLGVVQAGLDLGGPLPEDASAGTSGVIINGRQLQMQEAVTLKQLLPLLTTGRYWVDAQGNMGYEGGPGLVNLVAIAQQSGAANGPWSHSNSNLDSHVGGDGQFLYYIDKDSSATSN